MRRKVVVFAVILILSACLAGYSNYALKNEPAIESSIETSTSTAEDAKKEESDIPGNTSEPFIGRKDLDSETEKFFYGTWSVEKLLGFADHYNDASEYPTGQKIIGNQIIIDKDFFSSKGFEGYKTYQFELDKPIYDIEEIHYNVDSFYRVDKIDLKSINMNDEVKILGVSDSSTGLAMPIGFLDVNNDRLLLMLEATVFELKRVTESSANNDALAAYNNFLAGRINAQDLKHEISDGAITIKDISLEPDLKTYYALFDMNRDGISELHLRPIVGGSFTVFTYIDGQIVLWHDGPDYESPLNNGAILYERDGAAPTHVNYYYLVLDSNGNEVSKVYFSKYHSVDESTLTESADYDVFMFEDKEVSEDEWNSLTNEYLSISSDLIIWNEL